MDEFNPDSDASMHDSRDAALDAGLRAAFGRLIDETGGAESGVVSLLEQRVGVISRVLLREESDETAPLAMPRQDASHGTGAVAGRYQVLGEIARGGVGVVLKGRDIDLGRDVAMKVLQPAHADNANMVQRFIEEAQIAGQLQHPGILPVYELGLQADQRPFFTMKLVKGRTLAALLTDRHNESAELERFIGIFEQVCQTMAYAHSRGVVHRDLKPSNILVGQFGEVQVVDWGLAKVLAQGGVADERPPAEPETVIQTVRSDEPGSRSLVGSVMGTPAYMAPEQARGEVAQVDERTDVFALGGMLCEVLTGDPPFRDRAHRMVAASAANDIADAISRLDECESDADLVALAKACLAPQKLERPRTAKAVADAITAHRQSIAERARAAALEAAAATARAGQERRARRLTFALAATVLLAATLGFAAMMWVQQERAARRAEAARQIDAAMDQARTLLGDARLAPIGQPAAWQTLAAAATQLNEMPRGELDSPRVERLESLLDQIKRASRDRALFEALEDAVVTGATHEDKESWLWMERRLRELFLQYGIDPVTMSSKDIADRIRASELAVQLADSFELWIGTGFHLLSGFNHPLYSIEQLMGWVDVLYDADTDPVRTSVRRILYSGQPTVEQIDALAASLDFRQVQPRTLSWLAASYWRTGASDRVLDVYRRAVLLYPDDFLLNFDFAYQLAPAGRTEEAIRYYIRCLGIRPNAAGVWRKLGIELRTIGDLEGSAAALEESISRQGDYAPTHVDLGLTYLAMDRLEDAEAACAKAQQMQPDLAMASCCLGLIEFHHGNEDAAVLLLRRAGELGLVHPGWKHPSLPWIEQCLQRLDTLEGGKSEP